MAIKHEIKRGDVYQLGPHRLMCGDVTQDDLAPLLEGVEVRMLLTEPPYSTQYAEAEKKTEGEVPLEKPEDSIKSEAEYTAFIKSALLRVLPYLAGYNAVYIFTAEPMYLGMREALRAVGVYYSQMIIWIKNTTLGGRKDYIPQHEIIVYGWFGRHKFEHSKRRSVILHPRQKSSQLHPSQKPVGLLRELILNATQIGEAVLDPFAGSGSTLMACEHTKRVGYLVEIDPVYCDTIVQRWETLTELKAIKL